MLKLEPVRRLQACTLALQTGIGFSTDARRGEARLHFIDVDAAQLQRLPLVSLRRPSAEVLAQQLDLVIAWADLRATRAHEIALQLSGQIVPFWTGLLGLHPVRHAATLELLALSLSLAVDVHMRFKQLFACPRPVTLSSQVQPIIATPDHGSWPSGHSTEAHLSCTLLWALASQDPHNAARKGDLYPALQRLAARVAINRTVAGVHFPVDSAAGRVLGTALAEFVIARCTGDSRWRARSFDGTAFTQPNGDPIDFDATQGIDAPTPGHGRDKEAQRIRKDALLAFMWERASREWKGAGA
ncbi:MAG: phosphatase PAP2 family protein [Betaproteobacteria bacterium]|nr:phosphatase PAP2 family protein [Betaproteobacteria bacterium]